MAVSRMINRQASSIAVHAALLPASLGCDGSEGAGGMEDRAIEVQVLIFDEPTHDPLELWSW